MDDPPEAPTVPDLSAGLSKREVERLRDALSAAERDRVEATVADLLDLLGRAHAMGILSAFAFADGPLRFSELGAELDVAPNTLSAGLSELTDAGLLDREAYDEVRASSTRPRSAPSRSSRCSRISITGRSNTTSDRAAPFDSDRAAPFDSDRAAPATAQNAMTSRVTGRGVVAVRPHQSRDTGVSLAFACSSSHAAARSSASSSVAVTFSRLWSASRSG